MENNIKFSCYFTFKDVEEYKIIAKDSIELIRELQKNESAEFCLVEKILLRIGQNTSHLDMEP